MQETTIGKTSIGEMKHLKEPGMSFDPRMAYQYMSKIKSVVKTAIWNCKFPEWFVKTQSNIDLPPQGVKLKEFVPEESTTLDYHFKIVFSSGKVLKGRLHEQ